MAIIVLSHQLGAGGPEIGLALSQRLGYRYVDQELLQDAGRRYGLAEEKLSHLDDSKPSFFERFDTETRHHITVLQTTLLELAELTREIYNQRTAAHLVRSDDNEKAGRMRYLYEVEISDPMLYDLIVNTETLRNDAVVQMIEALVRRPEMATTEAGRQMIASRALASRVQVALATHPETRRYRITVEAQDGVVTLEGTTALDRAVEVARTVPGVRDARTQQEEIPPIPPFVA